MNNLYFSGIQPTGNLHLGNYIGAIKPWVALQKKENCIFCIADMHSITIPQNPTALHETILETFAMYMAAGIDIEKNIVFVQSSVPAHTELSWILSCSTPMGWMNRMTQYKDKIAKDKNNATLGLFSYPILMAADILLYKATHVPVGNDQKQHVEITRDIAQVMNNKFETEFFPLPEPVIPEVGARIMSLRDGTKKMSKSDDSDMSRINLTDDDDLIATKIRKAKTDSFPIPENEVELQQRPEVANLLAIFSSISNSKIQDILNIYAGQNLSQFKKDLSDLLITTISPIRNNFTNLISNKNYLMNIILNSNEKALKIAEKNISDVKKLLGLYI